MQNLKKLTLPLVVFITGACVLVVEVVATRILSPYFGNTVFTVSSVISVVLAALSIGYYFGGKLADKQPSEKIFYYIILASGLSLFLVQFLIFSLLPYLGYSLSISIGPLISSVLFFFFPSLLLGTLSPFAIKLQTQKFPKKGVGSLSGEIFFFSTLGSIVGSFMTGFLLIPFFGIDQIIMGVGLILVLVGLLPMLLNFKRNFIVLAIIILAILCYAIFISTFKLRENDLVYSRNGLYEKLTIVDGLYEGKPTRFFLQDRSSSAAMYLKSDELVYDYTKYYSIYKILKPELKNILVIGGGAYSIPKAFLNDLPNANVDVSEIEPSLYSLAKQYFRLSETSQLKNYTEDGRRLLRDTDKTYDLIFSDVYYSLYSIPAHFTTEEFFRLAKSKLSPDGIFMANLIGSLDNDTPSLTFSEIKTFKNVFENSYFFAVDSPSQTEAQNIIVLGINGSKKIDFSLPQVSNSDDPIIKSLRSKQISLKGIDFSKHYLLTDNYAPVDYLTNLMIQKSGY